MAAWIRILDATQYAVANGIAQLNGSAVLPHEQGGLEADVSAFNGLVKISGGTTSAITDSSSNWDTAYTHSQTTGSNPHQLTPNLLNALTATWDLGGTFAVRSSFTPANDSDLTNKAYVDSLAQGLDIKASVRVNSVSTSTEGTGYSYSATGGASGRGQITWTTGPTAIDGVTLANNNRILNSETGAAGGIWVRTAQNTWDRATDFDEDDEVSAGAFIFVEEGTTYADSGWVLTTNNPITIGGASGTSLAWAQFSGAGQITAGAGLTKSGNTIDVNGTTDRITVDTDSVDIASTYVGQTSITTLGNISTGQWLATQIAPTRGGTGLTTFSSGNVLYASANDVWAAAAPGATSGVQPYDADLAAIAGLANSDGNFIVGNGSTWVAENGDTARTSLGLGSANSPTFADLTLSGDLVFTSAIKTIATGAITITTNLTVVAAESGTADDLDTVNGGQSGQVAWFRADTGDTITIKNATGNIQSSGGDITMDPDTLIPMVFDGTNWHVTDFAGSVGTHGIASASHTADTLANFNTKISDQDAVGTTETQTISNKSLVDASVSFVDDGDNTKALRFQLSGVTTGNTRVLSVPDFNGTIATLAGTETFTNKSLVDSSVSFVDNGDSTKQLRFELSGITTGNVRTLSVPNYSETIATQGGTETLTNKTLTSPDINGGTVDSITSLTAGGHLDLGGSFGLQARIAGYAYTTAGRPATGFNSGKPEIIHDTTVNALYWWQP